MPPERSERGFTLVEVLVALVIAALLTAILLDGAAAARRRVARADALRQAVFLAGTLLAERTTAPYTQEPADGTTNGLVWRVEETIVVADPRGLYALVRVEADIDDATGHRLFAADTRALKTLPRT